MGVSKNRGGPPKSSIFNRVFPYKPSILGYHYFWKYLHLLPLLDSIFLPTIWWFPMTRQVENVATIEADGRSQPCGVIQEIREIWGLGLRYIPPHSGMYVRFLVSIWSLLAVLRLLRNPLVCSWMFTVRGAYCDRPQPVPAVQKKRRLKIRAVVSQKS